MPVMKRDVERIDKMTHVRGLRKLNLSWLAEVWDEYGFGGKKSAKFPSRFCYMPTVTYLIGRTDLVFE